MVGWWCGVTRRAQRSGGVGQVGSKGPRSCHSRLRRTPHSGWRDSAWLPTWCTVCVYLVRTAAAVGQSLLVPRAMWTVPGEPRRLPLVLTTARYVRGFAAHIRIVGHFDWMYDWMYVRHKRCCIGRIEAGFE